MHEYTVQPEGEPIARHLYKPTAAHSRLPILSAHRTFSLPSFRDHASQQGDEASSNLYLPGHREVVRRYGPHRAKQGGRWHDPKPETYWWRQVPTGGHRGVSPQFHQAPSSVASRHRSQLRFATNYPAGFRLCAPLCRQFLAVSVSFIQLRIFNTFSSTGR